MDHRNGLRNTFFFAIAINSYKKGIFLDQLLDIIIWPAGGVLLYILIQLILTSNEANPRKTSVQDYL